jgi:hypothetical protein
MTTRAGALRARRALCLLALVALLHATAAGAADAPVRRCASCVRGDSAWPSITLFRRADTHAAWAGVAAAAGRATAC